MKELISLGAFFGMAMVGWLIPFGMEHEEAAQPLPIEPSQRKHRTGPGNPFSMRDDLRRLNLTESRAEKWRQVIFLATNLPIEELADLCRSGQLNLLDEPYRSLFKSLVLERWVEHDPEAMLAWYLTQDERENDIEVYLAKWASSGREGVMEFLESCPAKRRRYWTRNFFQELMRTDPAQGFELAMASLADASDENPLGHHDAHLIASVASHDPQRFKLEREGWSDDLKKLTAPALATALMLENFDTGLDLLRAEQSGPETFARAISGDHTGTLLAQAMEHSSDLPEGWCQAMLTWKPGHFPTSAGLDLLLQGADQLGFDEKTFSRFARSFLSDKGSILLDTPDRREKLATYLNRDQTDPEVAVKTLAYSIRNWPTWDEEGLRDWLREIDHPPLQETIDQSLLSWEERSRPTARQNPRELLLKMATGEEQQSLPNHNWNRQELSEVKQAFQDLDSQERSRSFEALSQASFERFPLEFGRIVFSEALHNIGSEDGVRKLVEAQWETFVDHWAELEPAKAAEWTKTLPESPEQRAALRQVVQRWQQYAPEEVRAWVGELPRGEQEGLLGE